MRYLRERRSHPFAWGRRANDCVSYAAGAVLALTGRDALAGLPDWRSRRGAIRALAGVGGIEPALDGLFPRVAISRAQRGDVALIATEVAGDDAMLLAIVEGEILSGPGGVTLPRGAMLAAWSVD